MTALAKYVRLEALGIWREGPGSPPREVVAALGRTTLLLKDIEERPLGHWALAGVVRIGADGDAVTYSMTADGGETLTIRDREMTEAIAALSRPHLATGVAARRRRRLPLVPIAALAALVALAVAAPRWIPVEAALLVPPERASELGDRLLIHLVERGGPPCEDPDTARVLDALLARLAPGPRPRVRVMALDASPAALLPGDTLLLDRALVRGAPPEVIAGWAAAVLATDPLAIVLAVAGPAADVRFLLTGAVDDRTLARAADAISAVPDLAGRAAAAARLAEAGIDPVAFAEAAGVAPPPAPALVEPLLDAVSRQALAHGCG